MEPFLFSVHMTLPFLSNLALIAFILQLDSLRAIGMKCSGGNPYRFKCGTNHAHGSSLPCAGTALPKSNAKDIKMERISFLTVPFWPSYRNRKTLRLSLIQIIFRHPKMHGTSPQ